MHRLVCLSVLLSIVASFVPLPVGVAVVSPGEKDRSEPFPCADRPCGCRSAQQCWKKCCCFTHEQKLAWARKNRVKVPELVISQAKKSSTAAFTFESLLARRPAKTCCSQRSGVKTAACESPRSTSSPKSRMKTVIGTLAQQCQGEGLAFNSLPWTLLPEPVQIALPTNICFETAVVAETLLREVSISPPVPPPRCA
ncbi:hypothetical protein SH661x_003198 [Planctomicrobium sp. SH661]|uniref:hypothetical protein n=1 Tax=Planctomicrobium sp. SH661 TaxID=3448124 RepID=UPI003F5B0A60